MLAQPIRKFRHPFMTSKAVQHPIDPPPGFEPYHRSSAFLQLIGPLYQAGSGVSLRAGLRIDARHANRRGVCHGGLLSAVADTFLTRYATIARYGEDAMSGEHPPALVTVHLSVDYLGPVRMGEWIEFAARVDRIGKKLVHTSGLITADGKPAVRAYGIFQAKSG